MIFSKVSYFYEKINYWHGYIYIYIDIGNDLRQVQCTRNTSSSIKK